LEALQRATGQNLGMPVTGETPKGEHLFPDRDDTRNLEVLTEKVGTLELRRKRNCGGAAKKRARRARQGGGLLPGTLPAANPRFKAARHRLCRSPVHLGSRAKISARELLAVCLRTGRLRGPGAVGNLAMPELLRRA
jgi:hypothetical protein